MSGPSGWNTQRRYRLIYKPLVHIACLVPIALCVGATLHGFGLIPFQVYDLGVDPVRRLLGICGKTAINLLLITLAVTPLRQISGNANLVRLRRMLGLYAFFYALTHFVIYIWPYQGLSWDAIAKDIVKRPYITIGFAALLMLVPLAVTSTQGMMRRLKRRWQQLHRLIYVIAICAVWHYWWQVKKDIREPLLYAAILSILLGWRIWKKLYKKRAQPAPA
ncbi:MAG: protein-methionine-sulfoxide reductase heme-binding subunit MsrQ [Steroidobacteraceae bacterium]